MPRKLLFLILAMSFSYFFVLNNVYAEEGFNSEDFPYKEMQLQLMPEFDYPENWPKDKPSMLVGYYGTFINKTGKDFNGKIEFPLPVNGENFSVYLVAEFPEENKPEVQRSFEIDKEKSVVTWKPGKTIKADATYNFVIEYYDSAFKVEGDKKEFNFDFISPSDIEKLDVIVYTPLNSKSFTIDPKPEATTKSEYGQVLNQYQLTKLQKGKTVSYSAEYVKEGNESALSIISKMNPPSDENHPGTKGDQSSQSDDGERPIINTGGAIIIGVSIIIAGGLVFWGIMGSRRQSAGRTPKKPVKKRASAAPSKVTELVDEKKKLRSMLLNGKIDQKTYEERMKKLI